MIDNLNARINAWWAMVPGDRFRLLARPGGGDLLFYGVSFYALREFITLTPTRRSDYPALVAAFYFVLPMQYLLIYIDWYSMFSIFIPVYVFLLLPILASLGGDTKHFSSAPRKCSGLMLAVFLYLLRAGAADPRHSRLRGAQPAADRLPGDRRAALRRDAVHLRQAVRQAQDRSQPVAVEDRRRLRRLASPWPPPSAPSLWWITPFNLWQAALIALLINLLGFFAAW
ncbi:phosphatidate cytidylyltransferase [Pseudomonas aeruginosa]|uniref:phosphatidate cytidylyltransferase n=1 Tax=Pseudomonas aeruginosa TaxID=287 RepID=UPI003D26CB76